MLRYACWNSEYYQGGDLHAKLRLRHMVNVPNSHLLVAERRIYILTCLVHELRFHAFSMHLPAQPVRCIISIGHAEKWRGASSVHPLVARPCMT